MFKRMTSRTAATMKPEKTFFFEIGIYDCSEIGVCTCSAGSGTNDGAKLRELRQIDADVAADGGVGIAWGVEGVSMMGMVKV